MHYCVSPFFMSQTFQKLGRYIIVDEIAKGGMATIYRGKLIGVAGFEKDVAIKQILPYWSHQEEFIHMLIDEAKTLVHLHHNNIVQVIELAKEDDSYFIVMEFVDGFDVRKLLKALTQKQIQLPLQIACFIIKEVLRGLEFAHKRKSPEGKNLEIVHRDISPQNILVGYDGNVKITDFGIAKVIGKNTETAAGVLKGKFSYMSPEQATGKDLDHKTDLFALGSVFYELIFNQKAFDGKNDFETIEKVKNIDYNYPFEIDDDLKNILHLALHADPEKRFQSAQEFRKHIQDYETKNQFSITSEDLREFLHENFERNIQSAVVKSRELTKQTRIYQKQSKTNNTAQTIIHAGSSDSSDTAQTVIETKILKPQTENSNLSFSKSVTKGLSDTISEKKVFVIGTAVALILIVLFYQIINTTPNSQEAKPAKQSSIEPKIVQRESHIEQKRPFFMRPEPHKEKRILSGPTFLILNIRTNLKDALIELKGPEQIYTNKETLALSMELTKPVEFELNITSPEHKDFTQTISLNPANPFALLTPKLIPLEKTFVRLTARPYGEVSLDNGNTFYSSPHLFSVVHGTHTVSVRYKLGQKKLVKNITVANQKHQDCVAQISKYSNELNCTDLKIENKMPQDN